MRDIKPLHRDDLTTHTDIAFRSYPSFKDFSTEGKNSFTTRMRTIHNNDPVQFLGMYEEDQLLAQMRILTFQMNLFGKVIPVAGLGSLAVDLPYKKQGIAHKMLQKFEQIATDQQLALATLLPFSPRFYHEQGYGYGTKLNVYHLATQQLPRWEADRTLRLISCHEASALTAFHDQLTNQTHGMAKKMIYEWLDLFQKPEYQIFASYDDTEKIEGYLCFSFENAYEHNYTQNRIVVHELQYTHPLVLRKLLNFLRIQEDQAQTILFKTFLPDIHFLLEEPIAQQPNYIDFGYLQCNTQYLGNMYKILDIPLWFQQTRHRQYPRINLTVQLLITGEAPYLVRFQDGHAHLLESGKPDITISLALADFSALFMGVTTVKQLYQLAVLKLDQPALLADLDQLLAIPEPPVCWSDY